MMLIDSSNSDLLKEPNQNSSKLIGFAAALLVAVVLLGGYFFVRNRHARQVAAAKATAPVTSNTPKGPAKLHVLVDEPLIKSGESLIGGTVRNISNEALSDISVELELWRRADSSTETKLVSVVPASLAPNEEGRYALKISARDYANVRLGGFQSGTAGSIAYTSAPGQQRPMEKTESKTITVQRSRSRGGEEFLNTPDNPGRVP